MAVHQDETAGVPELIRKIPGGFDTFRGETHIVSGGVAGHQREPEGVGAVLGDDLQWIDTVPQGFAHLPALGIPDQSVEEDCAEGLLSHLLVAGEHHADHPEEDDVVARNQHIRGIEVFQILRLLGPAQSGEGPKCRGKPGVQSVGILGHMDAAAFRALLGLLSRHHQLPALVAGVGRDPVSPPKLTGNAPVADIVGPVEVKLVHALRHQLDLPCLHSLSGGFDQLVHLHEPLKLDHGLNGGVAAVVGAYVMGVVLDLHQKAQGIQFLHDLLSGFVPVKSRVFAAVLVNGGVVVHDVDLGKTVALAHLEVVGVVGRRDLNNAGTEFHIHVLVFHHRDRFPYDRKIDLPSVEIGISLVLRVYGHRRISQHSLRSRGGKGQKLGLAGFPVFVDQRIFDMPQMGVLFLVAHLGVGNGGVADRAPVDDAAALIDPSLFMHPAEHFRNGLVAALVHGEAFSLPVA